MGFLNREKILQNSIFAKESLESRSGFSSTGNFNGIKSVQPFVINPEIRKLDTGRSIKPNSHLGTTPSFSPEIEFANNQGGHMSLRANFKKPEINDTSNSAKNYSNKIKPAVRANARNKNLREYGEKSLIVGESSGVDVAYEEKSGISFAWAESDSISNNDVN